MIVKAPGQLVTQRKSKRTQPASEDGMVGHKPNREAPCFLTKVTQGTAIISNSEAVGKTGALLVVQSPPFCRETVTCTFSFCTACGKARGKHSIDFFNCVQGHGSVTQGCKVVCGIFHDVKGHPDTTNDPALACRHGACVLVGSRLELRKM